MPPSSKHFSKGQTFWTFRFGNNPVISGVVYPAECVVEDPTTNNAGMISLRSKHNGTLIRRFPKELFDTEKDVVDYYEALINAKRIEDL